MEDTTTRRAAYEGARAAFDQLRLEDKAVFLLESLVTTVARGVEAAAQGVADAIDDVFTPPPPETPPAEPTFSDMPGAAPDVPPAAEPPPAAPLDPDEPDLP